MASYEAQINVILNGQRSIDLLASSLGEVQAAIDQIERRWRSATQLIQRSQIRLNAIGDAPPRGQGGRFAPDPNRQARFEAYAVQRRARQEEFLSRRAATRARSEEALTRAQMDNSRELIRLAERRAQVESRLNSANVLFQRQVQAFTRGGGGARLSPELQGRAREAQAAYDAIGGAASRNRGLVSALATEMTRVVQAQNEINRGASLRSKAFETSRRTFERISAVEERGVTSQSRIRRARNLAAPITEAASTGDQFAYSEAVRRANAFIARLERESRDTLNRSRAQRQQELRNAISSPIRGGISFPGSPIALREAAKVNERTIGQSIKNAISSPIRGGVNFPGSPIAIEASRQQDIRNALSSPIRGGLNFPGSPIAIEAALKKQAVGYPSSPIMGGVNMPGSPIFNQTPFLERRFGKRGGAAISEGLIGGAFPLLFGQGLGSSIGGGLGGALGGFAGGGLGFGLSLIGTALGSAIDGLATAAKDAAAAMRDPITNFQKLADAGLFASKSQELQIKNLIEYGNSTKAAAVIQEELAKKIGVLAMRDMANLDEQSVRLGKAWAELSYQIQAAIAGPLAGLLEWVTSVVELFAGGNRREAQRKDFIESLTPAGKIEYNRRKALNLYGATGESEAAIQQSLKGMTVPLAKPASKIDPAVLQQEQDKNRQEQRDKDDRQLQRAREVEDYIRNSKNQTRQFEYQRIDLERQSWDSRRRINDDIFNKQQQIQRDQIAADRLRQQIAIDTVDLQYRKQISNEEGRAAAVLSAEADLVKLRKTNAAEIEASRRGLELDITKQQRETQNYIYGLAREADSIRRATLNYELQVEEYKISQARKLADINKQALRDQQDAQIKADRGSPVYSGLINRSGTPYTGGDTVSGFPISSRPGMRWGKAHRGVDVAMPIDTALGYSLGGIVKSVAPLRGYGKTLEVELENGVIAFAAHLNSVLVKVGDKFTANQILARTGMSGNATGPSTHFEGTRGGDPYAPLPYVVLGSGVSAAAAAKPKPKPKPQDFTPIPSSTLSPRGQTDVMSGGISSSNIGNQFLSMLGNRNGFEDTAGPGAARKPWVGSAGQFANKGSFQNGLDAINKAGASPFGFYQANQNDLQLIKKFYSQNPNLPNQYDLPVNFYLRYLSGIGTKGLEVGNNQGKLIYDLTERARAKYQDPKNRDEYINKTRREFRASYRKKFANGLFPVDSPDVIGNYETANSLGRYWAKKNKDMSFTINDLFDFPTRELKAGGGSSIPEVDAAMNMAKFGKPFGINLRVNPDGKVQVVSPLGPRSSAPGNFDTSKLQRIIGSTATVGSLEGLIAGNPAPAADILPPKIEPVPPSKVRGQMQAIDARDAKVKQEIIDLTVKANQLGEEGAYQRLIDLATGDKTVKQKQRELRLVEAEARSIGMMSSDKQEFATFDARAIESLIQIQEENDTILKNTRLQGKEKEKLAEANEAYLKNAMDTLAVERLMLSVQQEQRFNGEKIAAQMQLQIRGAGANAGFYGAAAQAYNQEIAKSGNVQQATDLAKLAKANEVNDQITSMRENLLMLQDPTYQVVESAKAIGSAFSDSFKGVVSGSTTAQQALANFFQRTSDHFLEMAAQMLTQQLVLKLIGFGMNLFAPGANALGGDGGIGSVGGLGSVVSDASGIGSVGGLGSLVPNAKGNVFTNSIVSSPTLFKFASGGALSNGVMGEAGPEAIMPLTRGPGGRLGVDASGSGGGVNVTVNVDAKGSSVQGDDQRSGELGRAIATAVQQELIKQKRSGGILSK